MSEETNDILLIEDDPDTIDILRAFLSLEGFHVVAASDGLEGMRLFEEFSPEFVILDLMLPGINGMDICRRIRSESDVPIIMLTALAEEKDTLAGLNLGADDYIVKPFSPRELVARVKAVLRRSLRDNNHSDELLNFSEVEVDLKTYKVKVSGKPVRLTPTEMRLLVMFMRDPGRVFSRSQIVSQIFNNDYASFGRTVDAHLSNLRRKLEGESAGSKYIHTLYGVGYRFGEVDDD